MSENAELSGMKPNDRKFILYWSALLFVMLIMLFIYKALIVSIIFSFFCVYILAPIVHLVESRIVKSRILASLIVVVGVFGVFGALIASMVPYLYEEAIGLIKLVPTALSGILTKVEPLKAVVVEKGLIRQEALDGLFDNLDLVNQLFLQLRGTVNKVWSSTPQVLGGVVNFLLVPLMCFFTLRELEGLKHSFISTVPTSIRSDFRQYLKRLDEALKSVLKGQVIVAFSLAVMYMIGLGSIGIKFGLGIGAIAGCFRVIPYFDVIVGVALCLIVILSEGYGLGVTIAVGLVFLLVQVLDGTIITPRIIGDRTGLHPGLVVVTIFAFADWFGFYGVLLSIPFLAIFVVTVETFYSFYKSSNFYRRYS